ncbi:Uncharacterised protein [Vibrio anguillarum]|nr:Uncharacterised protein [Vibrio anguillarum]
MDASFRYFMTKLSFLNSNCSVLRLANVLKFGFSELIAHLAWVCYKQRPDKIECPYHVSPQLQSSLLLLDGMQAGIGH